MNAEFIKSIADLGVYDNESERLGKPEIAVAGRSNVGKSSFINMIAERKNLAKTSSTPGRTRLLNLFSFGEFILVDLPGYGYAKASKSEIRKWSMPTDGYFSHTSRLVHTLALVDIRHEPSELDKRMISYLYDSGKPFTVIATKADKLSRAACARAKSMIASALKIGVDDIIVTSASSGQGRDAVWNRINSVLSVNEDPLQ